jgi:HlyD family secretion protein
MNPTPMRPSIFSLAPLMMALALGGCHKPAPKETSTPAQARSVRVIRLEPRVIAGALAASGDLIPREEAAVLPEVTGYRVAAVLADVGDYVRQGEPLVRLDPALIQAQVAQQEALAAQAEVQAQQAQAEAARVAGLDNSGVLAQEQIEQRRSQARAARASANAQAAALRDLRTRAGKLTVVAPVSGLVLERTVRPGDLSASGSTPWFRLARDGQIELQAQMGQDDLARVRPGQSAQVSLTSGQNVTGVVRLVSPQIDPETKLGFARLTLPVRADIRAGGSARAVFDAATGQGLAVPETAIRYDAEGASVMIVQPNNRVRRVTVRTGERGGGWVRLTQGPSAGSVVVRNAAAFLVEGDAVKPVFETAQAGARPAAPAKAGG